MQRPKRTYVGIHNDAHGGMSSAGKVVRDAWVFSLIPESETCEGWDLARLNALSQQVNEEWDKYGCMVSKLPEELFTRHQRIYNAAIETAKSSGWTGEDEMLDDD